ncbi:hypothetical protein BGZ97_004510 [Linnemannia gamsii]|uniref:Uncharacterized protein n=1 Tax=Linnemannia gamsii TaxID=64522 RepID=A0A9P6UGZ2_9FUNG|nr:hypothetical protein BGZ97_004510 [Linnemannia gamsii]
MAWAKKVFMDAYQIDSTTAKDLMRCSPSAERTIWMENPALAMVYLIPRPLPFPEEETPRAALMEFSHKNVTYYRVPGLIGNIQKVFF